MKTGTEWKLVSGVLFFSGLVIHSSAKCTVEPQALPMMDGDMNVLQVGVAATLG